MYQKKISREMFYTGIVILFQLSIIYLMYYYLKFLPNDINLEMVFILFVGFIFSEKLLFKILCDLIKKDETIFRKKYSLIFQLSFYCQFLIFAFFILFFTYNLIFYLLKNEQFKFYMEVLYKTIQPGSESILLHNFVFLFFQFIFFLILYIISNLLSFLISEKSEGFINFIIKKRYFLKDLPDIIKEYIIRFKELFPISISAIIIMGMAFTPIYKYLEVRYTYFYFLLIFISSCQTINSCKKRVTNGTNTGFECFLVIYILIIGSFLVIFATGFSVYLLQGSSELSKDNTKLFYYVTILGSLIYFYLASYGFYKFFKFDFFSMMKFLIYFLLFVSYICARLKLFNTDILEIILGKIFGFLDINFKTLSKDYFTEAFLTFVIFDSVFQNGSCFFADLRNKIFLKFKKTK